MVVITKDRKSHTQKSEFMEERFDRFFNEIIKDSSYEYDKEKLAKIKAEVIEHVNSKKELEADKLFDLIIRASNEHITANTPEFTYLSASALRRKLYKHASKNRGFDYKSGYGDYYSFAIQMVEQGIYDESILNSYTEQELRKAGKLIDVSKDKKFSYAGLFMLNNTYLKKGYQKEILELPQERFLTVALYLMRDEKKSKRMDFVREAYWALSNHLIGLATPTLLNAGGTNGTLSSCHIITPDDDLKSIMRSVDQTAMFSQNGAGIGKP